MIGTDNVDPLSHLGQYGLVGAILCALFAVIIIPLMRAMLSQNNRLLDQYKETSGQNATALDLLKRSVDSQVQAVQTFQRIEAEHRETRELLQQRLDRQEELLRKMAP